MAAGKARALLLEPFHDGYPLLSSEARTPSPQHAAAARRKRMGVPPWMCVAGASAALVVLALVFVVAAWPKVAGRRDSTAHLRAVHTLDSTGACGIQYNQCGGLNFVGAKCCQGSCTCSGSDMYYKQCEPPMGSQVCSAPGDAAPDPSPAPAPMPALPADMVTRCAGAGEACTSSKCCNSPDLHCYQRDLRYAACNSSCSERGPDGKDWSCKKLSSTGPKIFKTRTAACAWGGETCQSSDCCKVPGMKCFEKNPGYATCKWVCVKGPDPTEADGQSWSCVTRPAPPVTYLDTRLFGASKPSKDKTSLFCLTFVAPKTYEVDLVAAQKKKGLGIFSCDDSAVFESGAFPVDQKQEVDTEFAIPKVLSACWNDIRQDGRYADHDWTVKVHPDAMFLPQRLLEHLDKLGAPKNTRLYLKKDAATSNEAWLDVGALHVISNLAMKMYMRRKASCESKLYNYGEGFFINTCLDSLDVGHIVDTTLLLDEYMVNSTWGTDGDARCRDPRWVTFHPLKDIDAWMECHEASQAKE